MHRLPYKKHEYDDDKYNVGECIYMDLCGPMSVSLGGHKFFMLAKDKKSSYLFVYFLKHKNEAVSHFIKMFNEIHTQLGKPVKMVRTDGGLEFCNKEMHTFLRSKGSVLGNSAPYCQEQNGRIERENRTIVEAAHTMIHAKGIARSLWAEAVNSAVYAMNRTTNCKKDKVTPYGLWHKKKPNIAHMRPFGSEAFALIPKIKRVKFDKKSEKAILVGYQDTEDKN